MNADLSSHLLVLCAASEDPWAVGWQDAGRVRGGGEQQAVPGRHACAQLLGMCDVRIPPSDNKTEMKVSVFVSKISAYLKMGYYTQKVYTCMRQIVSNLLKLLVNCCGIHSHASVAAAAAAALRLRLAARSRSSFSYVLSVLLGRLCGIL
jgi:hypothetical protein